MFDAFQQLRNLEHYKDFSSGPEVITGYCLASILDFLLVTSGVHL